MAQVTARKRGAKWEYRFELASVGGQRKQYSKSGFATKKEALKAGTEAFAKYNRAGVVQDPKEISVSDYLDLWLETYAKQEVNPNTYGQYLSYIEHHIRPQLGHYKLAALTRATIRSWIVDLATSGLSQGTVTNIQRVLSGTLSYAAYTLEWIYTNPAAGLGIPATAPTPKPKKKVISPEEFSAIIAGLDPESPHRLALLIGWWCGMRVNEVCSLTWDRVDFDANIIKVDRQVTQGKFASLKSKSSVREIQFGETLREELLTARQRAQENVKFYAEYYHRYRVADEDKIEDWRGEGKPGEVFFVVAHPDGTKIHSVAMSAWVNGRAKDVGINFSFHSLRHTHATLLIQGGAPIKAVQDRLGHKDASITMDIYAHCTQLQVDKTTEIAEKACLPTRSKKRGQSVDKAYDLRDLKEAK